MNTKKMLSESLEKLLKRKNLDDIQVSEIVAGAALSRKTFYRHFKDKDTRGRFRCFLIVIII